MSPPSSGGMTGFLMTVQGSADPGHFNMNKGKILGWEGAQWATPVHRERGRAIIPSSFCQRPRIIRTLISYQAATRGCGMNKLSAERGGLTKAPGFAESPWKNANRRGLTVSEAGALCLSGWAVPQAQVALTGSHGT